MCKFQKPVIPANATDDERRAVMFYALYSLDLSDKVEKYNDLTYLSWAKVPPYSTSLSISTANWAANASEQK